MGESQFYRVRTRVADAPGSLATLAQKCGAAGVNILGLQIYPDLGTVTDDMVIRVPENWTEDRVIKLIESAGGSEIAVTECDAQELQDQPTRWLAAVRALIDDPDRFEEEREALVGPREELSATEAVRVAALEGIVEALKSATPTPELGAMITFRESEHEVRAVVGRGTVGAASWEAVSASVARGFLRWRRPGSAWEWAGNCCDESADSLPQQALPSW